MRRFLIYLKVFLASLPRDIEILKSIFIFLFHVSCHLDLFLKKLFIFNVKVLFIDYSKIVFISESIFYLIHGSYFCELRRKILDCFIFLLFSKKQLPNLDFCRTKWDLCKFLRYMFNIWKLSGRLKEFKPHLDPVQTWDVVQTWSVFLTGNSNKCFKIWVGDKLETVIGGWATWFKFFLIWPQMILLFIKDSFKFLLLTLYRFSAGEVFVKSRESQEISRWKSQKWEWENKKNRSPPPPPLQLEKKMVNLSFNVYKKMWLKGL